MSNSWKDIDKKYIPEGGSINHYKRLCAFLNASYICEGNYHEGVLRNGNFRGDDYGVKYSFKNEVM